MDRQFGVQCLDKIIHLLQQRCNVTYGNFILLVIMVNLKLEQVFVLCEKCMAGWPGGQEKQHIQGVAHVKNFTKIIKNLKIRNK